MPIHTLTHPDLPGRELPVEVQPGRLLSPEYAKAGWVERVQESEPSADDQAETSEAEPTEQAPAPLDLSKEN